MENKGIRSATGSILTGLVLIGIGGGFLLQSLGYIDFSSYFRDYWPSLIILLGIIQLITNPSGWLGSLITMVIGGWLQLSVLGHAPENFWTIVWPLLLIIIGIRIMMGRVLMPRKADTRNAINSVNVFGGSDIKSESPSFEGGTATAIFGGYKLNLKNAKLSEKGAILNATSIFGGGEIIVPEDWKVEVSGLPLFGGWDDKTHTTNPSSDKVLKINATAIFGGLEIKN